MDNELVTLARFDWLMQANLVRSRLTASGIECVLLDEYTLSLFWYRGLASGGIRLQVSSEDLEDARAVLDESPLPREEPVLSDHEGVTERALRSAVFGVVQPLLLLWSCWLLLRVLFWRDPLTRREQGNVMAAGVLILLWGVLPVAISLLFVVYAYL